MGTFTSPVVLVGPLSRYSKQPKTPVRPFVSQFYVPAHIFSIAHRRHRKSVLIVVDRRFKIVSYPPFPLLDLRNSHWDSLDYLSDQLYPQTAPKTTS